MVTLVDHILKDHEIGNQHFVYAANGLERVELVFTRLNLDVLGLAREPRT